MLSNIVASHVVAELMSVVVVVCETHTPHIVIWWMLLLCHGREGSGWQR